MASTALTKAIKTLELQQKRRKTERAKEQRTVSELATKGGALVGAAGAAAIDRKFEGEGGAAPTMMGVPQAAVYGLAVVVAGRFFGGTIGDGVSGAGVGMICGAAYRYYYDRTDPGEAFPDGDG